MSIGPERKSRRQPNRPLPPSPTPPDTPAGFIAARHFRVTMDAPPFRGRVKRTRAPNPANQTPLGPPLHRRSGADRMPADLCAKVIRRTAKPPFVPGPPLVLHRRYACLWSFIPERGHSRRGKSILNEIGPSTPITGSRRIRAAVIPWPGRVRRAKTPYPDPEPQVLPPPRRMARSPQEVPPVRFRLRVTFLAAAASPPFSEPCPYRPHRDDPAETRSSFVQESDAQAGRPDEDATPPRRIDECQ